MMPKWKGQAHKKKSPNKFSRAAKRTTWSLCGCCCIHTVDGRNPANHLECINLVNNGINYLPTGEFVGVCDTHIAAKNGWKWSPIIHNWSSKVVVHSIVEDLDPAFDIIWRTCLLAFFSAHFGIYCISCNTAPPCFVCTLMGTSCVWVQLSSHA